MTSKQTRGWTDEQVDEFLFGAGVGLHQYFLSRTPVSESLCYVSPERRQFYLPISNNDLAERAIERLLALGVRIEQVGKS